MKLFRHMMQRYMKPEGEGDTGGGSVDRGDDFVPTPENEDEAAELARQQAEAAAKEGGKAEATAEELEAERAKLGLAAGNKTEAEKAAEALAAAEKAKDGEGEDKGSKKDTRIPLARHEAVLARERAAREALEVQLANVQKGQQVAQTNEQLTAMEEKLVKLEEQYTAALTEGNTKEAAALMRQVRETERTIIEQKAEFRTQAATAIAIEQVRLDATIERLEAAYPQLKPGHADFDQEKVAEIVELREAYELKGYAPSKALQKAVSILMPAETKKQENATTVAPRVSEDDAAAKLRAEREVEARKRNAATSDAQPPATAKVGANSDEAGGKLDAKAAIKMPFDKFKNLSEEDLSRMRGDTL